jgi:hypothetical protein
MGELGVPILTSCLADVTFLIHIRHKVMRGGGIVSVAFHGADEGIGVGSWVVGLNKL